VRRHRVGVGTVDASLEGHVTIALYDILEGKLVKRGHLLEDE
jgi:hypothetical protein